MFYVPETQPAITPWIPIDAGRVLDCPRSIRVPHPCHPSVFHGQAGMSHERAAHWSVDASLSQSSRFCRKHGSCVPLGFQALQRPPFHLTPRPGPLAYKEGELSLLYTPRPSPVLPLPQTFGAPARTGLLTPRERAPQAGRPGAPPARVHFSQFWGPEAGGFLVRPFSPARRCSSFPAL